MTQQHWRDGNEERWEDSIPFHAEISIRDVPAFMRVIEESAEIVRTANRLGFIPADAPEIKNLHMAIVCLSPDLLLDE